MPNGSDEVLSTSHVEVLPTGRFEVLPASSCQGLPTGSLQEWLRQRTSGSAYQKLAPSLNLVKRLPACDVDFLRRIESAASSQGVPPILFCALDDAYVSDLPSRHRSQDRSTRFSTKD